MLKCKHIQFSTIIIKTIFFQQRTINTRPSRKVWTVEESRKLLDLVNAYGNNWTAIHKHFTDCAAKTIAGRYYYMLTKTSGDLNSLIENDMQFTPPQPWSKKNDELLMGLVNEHGKQWTKLTTYFKNSTVSRLAQRYAQATVKSSSTRYHRWTAKEQSQLESLIKRYGPDFKKISQVMKTRTPIQCQRRYYYQTRISVDHFNSNEIKRIKQAVKKYGTEDFKLIIKKAFLPSTLLEKDVRQFYWRELDPAISEDEWTQEEIKLMVQLHNELDGCMEFVQTRLPIKRGLKDMWTHYNNYTKEAK